MTTVITSPCVGVCQLRPGTSLCEGCLRTASEIGEWSARICPFLSRPMAVRPDFAGQHATPGIMVSDNPGMCAVWVTREYRFGRDGLCRIGDPIRVSWWRRGVEVTSDKDAQAVYEARAALLRNTARDEGANALAFFERLKVIADKFSPTGLAYVAGGM